MEQGFYKNFSVKKVILSRGRWDTMLSHLILKKPDLLVCESEYEKYVAMVGDRVGIIKTIPDSVNKIAAIRNWILDKWDDEIVFMLDDDCESMIRIGEGKYVTTSDPDIIEQVIDNTALCARDAGAKVFGLNLTYDVRKFQENQPFKFNTWVDTTWGIIGRDIRFDENQHVKEDFDYCLASLLKHRIIWCDRRYHIVHKSRTNRGGMTLHRTTAKEAADLAYLQVKWGRHIQVSKCKGTVRLHTNVRRRQVIGKI